MHRSLFISARQQAVTADDIDEEREVRELFKNTAGVDLEVDPYELRTILDTNFKSGRVIVCLHSFSRRTDCIRDSFI